MIASICQPGTNGVRGSMMGHAWRTNSRKYLVASSRSTFARAFGFCNQQAKLFEFVMGKLTKFWCRADHDRPTTRATVLVAEVILVAQKILGQEDVRRR